MASLFGWLAVDPEQRRQMLEAVDYFRDRGTIDDLGIGAIRDCFSDTLFPGTSTLHTRLRYVLFVPWLLEIASKHDSTDEMKWAFHDLERDFIDTLKTSMGDRTEGIIGRRAGRNVQRTPSEVYWGMMLSWGVVERGLSAQEYFRRCLLQREQLRVSPHHEEAGASFIPIPTGIEPNLPPAPSSLLKKTTFDLTHQEAAYLKEQITQTCHGSLLVHLLHHRPCTWSGADSAPASMWSPEVCAILSPELLRKVQLAQRFSLVAQGASLLYNLLLAEAVNTNSSERFDGDLIDNYRNELSAWAIETDEFPPLESSDHAAIGRLMAENRRTFTTGTQRFLSRWFEAARTPHKVADSDEARLIIGQRERAVKGQRARLRPGNWKALDAWNGASGTNRMQYRWGYVRQHLQDIFDGLESV